MDYGIQAALNLSLEDKNWKGMVDLNSKGRIKYSKLEENPTLEELHDEYLIRLSIEKKNQVY